MCCLFMIWLFLVWSFLYFFLIYNAPNTCVVLCFTLQGIINKLFKTKLQCTCSSSYFLSVINLFFFVLKHSFQLNNKPTHTFVTGFRKNVKIIIKKRRFAVSMPEWKPYGFHIFVPYVKSMFNFWNTRTRNFFEKPEAIYIRFVLGSV